MKKAQKKNNQEQTKLTNEIVGVLLIALGIVIGISIYSSSGALFSIWMRSFFFGTFGVVGYAMPVCIAAGGIGAITARRHAPHWGKITAGAIGFLSLLTFIQLCYANNFLTIDGFPAYLAECYVKGGEFALGGGVLGGLLGYPLSVFIGNTGGLVLAMAMFIVCLMIVTNFSLKKVGEKIKNFIIEKHDAREEHKEDVQEFPGIEKKTKKQVKKAYDNAFTYKSQPIRKKQLFIEEVAPVEDDFPEELLDLEEEPFLHDEEREADREADSFGMEEEILGIEPEEEENVRPELDFSPVSLRPEKAAMSEPQHMAATKVKEGTAPAVPEQEKPAAAKPADEEEKQYIPPPISLLNAGSGGSANKNERDEIRTKADLLEKTLKNFNISAKVINVSKGPVVTRFELQPAPGIKVSRIVSLSDDIALNLAAPSIRIEAPIPGKAAIGIEVPNTKKTMVTAREMIDTDEFRNMKSKLAFAVGKDIAGKNVYGDLAKMPHLLIAGTTGSGKSVCVNAFIMSVLYHASPDEVEFIMIDPKVVELSIFNGIPHMKIPVITEPKKATVALNWAVEEMLKRYKQFADRGVKDLERFNNHPDTPKEERMPKIVIVIDELADLMMASASEVEDAICRIAQLGRASGIHIIIATQSPRVDIITGLIKANFPSRIALTVSNQVDSRVIIDMGGAEKLLKDGDMLYMPAGVNKPIRLQGCYISDSENEAVVNFLRNEHTGHGYDEDLAREVETGAQSSSENGEAEFGDALVPKAIELALEYEQVSISMLQRRLKVGYARAARLVDELEEKRIVTPAEGSKPRQVLITWDDYRRMMHEEDETATEEE